MSSNRSVPTGFCGVSSKMAEQDALNYQLYITGGTLITVFNLALGLIIVCHKSIRQQKEYLIYAGCMFFDVIFGLTYLSSGAFRLKVANENTYFPMTTKYECMMTVHNFLFVYITPGAGILVFVTAIDRFIGVFFPTKYMLLRTRYVYCLLFLIFTIPLIAIPIAVFTSMPYNVDCDQHAACILSQAITYQVYLGLRLIRIIGSLACVLFYVPISIKIFYNVSRASSAAYMATSQNRRLIRMTVTVILVTVNTICLYVVPDIILLFNPSTPSFAFYLMNMSKGLVNIVIFLVTQKTLRKAIMQSIKAKGANRSRLVSVTNNHIDQKTITVTSTRKFTMR
ncbi:hypothetical protein PRIPAC_96216 [Pristionchus pacificus]|uniref:G protein-coupled receptor n=1 Tax=Pristionchus pacificus TaxID=54126 RepID=A0A2A6BDL4_PRIPA|nr:hypothetical protein PRIPAC_96216 [Pristionchus pacificus]|eukprot:PDM63977.1 G protein-coupled receptor [Pristionchus pacificus]